MRRWKPGFAARPDGPGRSLAVARLRRAQMLAAISEDARATALLLHALPGLSRPEDAGLRLEALTLARRSGGAQARSGAGGGALPRGDGAGAPRTHALDRVAMRTRIARAAMFDDPAAVAADLDVGLAEAQTALAADKPGWRNI